MSGFTFCGKHCGDLGLNYIPDRKTCFPKGAKYSLVEETVTGRAGGYHYGEEVGIREFSLSCYFEDQDQTRIEEILNWFYRGRTGDLVFDDRPFISYTATVAGIVEGSLYNGKDATLTISLHAHDPFGKMLYTSFNEEDSDNASAITGIISTSNMPAFSPTPGDYLFYNPGSEYADTKIRIAGTAPNGVTIENRTTGASCKLLALAAEPDCLVIDSESGDVYLESDPEGHFFEAHDAGFIRLAPCVPYVRNVNITYTNQSTTISFLEGTITESNIGQYVLLGNEWMRVIAVPNKTSAVLNKTPLSSGTVATIMATMNEITVIADGAAFTTFEIEYTPKTR